MSETLFPTKFYQGIEQFNGQEFFEAHETLESVWKEHKAPDRIFIQGIIQIAAGCHHLMHSNSVGALSLFRKGIDKLNPFAPSYGKVDVEKLIDSVMKLQKCIDTVDAVDSERKISWPRVMLI